MNIKKNLLIAGALATGLMGTQAQALETGDWIFKAGPTLISPNDDSNSIDLVANSGVDVDDAWTLGFTIGYMISDNLSVQVLGIIPTEHDLEGSGSVNGLDIGDVDVLPPTLTLQYHFSPKASVRPYVGAGINYTYFYGESEDSALLGALGPNSELDIDSSIGLAAEIGVDVDIDDTWFANASLWYIDIDADATVKNTALGNLDVDVDIDPWVLMFAVGTTF